MNLLYYQFKLQSSCKLAAIILSVCIGAVLSICFIDVLWFIRVLSIGYICQNCYNHIKKYALLERSQSIITLWYEWDRGWFLKNRNQEVFAATINYPAFISNNIIIINFFLSDKFKKIKVVILSGMIPGEDFRKLKMLLRVNAD